MTPSTGGTGHVGADPYAGILAGYVPNCEKDAMRFVVRVVLTNQVNGRNLTLMRPPTRAVVRGGVVEFICTLARLGPGEIVKDVAYLCFAEALETGVLVVGDRVDFGTFEGTLIGFNDDHSPNHQNVVLRTPELVAGRDRGLRPRGDVVVRERTYST